MDTASLVIAVNSNPVAQADARLGSIAKTAATTEKATDKLVDSLKKLALAYISIDTALKAGHKLFEVTEEYGRLTAQIKTATGAGEDAREMFLQLDSIADESVFSLEEVTNAFTNLTNKGLDAGSEALRSYINTATALNVSLETVTDAVTTAAAGQFRGLQQLGIKAVETADGIVLTYRGASTKIRKDSKDIQDYIIALGQNQFAGAANERMKGLEGSVIRLKDAWDELFRAISEQGVGDLMGQGFQIATDALVELKDELISGQLMANIKAVGLAFTGWGDAVYEGMKIAIAVLREGNDQIKGTMDPILKFYKDAFLHLPENVLAAMQHIGAALGALSRIKDVVLAGLLAVFISTFKVIRDLATATGEYIGSALAHPINNRAGTAKLIADTQKAMKEYATTVTKTIVDVKKEVDDVELVWLQVGDAIEATRDKTIKSVEDQIEAAKRLRKAYDDAKKAEEERRANAGKNDAPDPLKSNRPTGSTRIITAEEIAAFEALRKSLGMEEKAIAESYGRRLDLIRHNTEAGSDLRLELEKSLEEAVTEEYAKAYQDRQNKIISLEDALNQAIAEGRMSIVNDLQTQLQHEEDMLAKSYEVRKEQILNDIETTEEEKNALLAALNKRQGQFEVEQTKKKYSTQLTLAADFFGNLATTASVFGKKGFEAAKAASIVQATIKTYEGAVSAYTSLAGIPYVGPALGIAAAAAAIAAGVANIQHIKSTSYSGAYAEGGMIPAGKWGITQEAGFEPVHGPAVVTSARNSADRGYGKENGGAGKVSVIVNNHTEVQAQVTERETPDGKVIEVLIKRAESAMTSGVRTGSSPFSKVLEQTYGLKRGAA